MNKKDEYSNNKLEDPFLESLAQGGFQVEELARMKYPNGHLIDVPPQEYQESVRQTNLLLRQDNVVIFEAAFLFDGLYVKSDIVIKQGEEIELIVV